MSFLFLFLYLRWYVVLLLLYLLSSSLISLWYIHTTNFTLTLFKWIILIDIRALFQVWLLTVMLNDDIFLSGVCNLVLILLINVCGLSYLHTKCSCHWNEAWLLYWLKFWTFSPNLTLDTNTTQPQATHSTATVMIFEMVHVHIWTMNWVDSISGKRERNEFLLHSLFTFILVHHPLIYFRWPFNDTL